jgi:hypothetical protein
MTTPLLIVRPLPGTVGERRRVAHLLSAPVGRELPEQVTAYCGAALRTCDLELLPALAGMPCELCLLRAPARSGSVPAVSTSCGYQMVTAGSANDPP